MGRFKARYLCAALGMLALCSCRGGCSNQTCAEFFEEEAGVGLVDPVERDETWRTLDLRRYDIPATLQIPMDARVDGEPGSVSIHLARSWSHAVFGIAVVDDSYQLSNWDGRGTQGYIEREATLDGVDATEACVVERVPPSNPAISALATDDDGNEVHVPARGPHDLVRAFLLTAQGRRIEVFYLANDSVQANARATLETMLESLTWTDGP